VAGLLLGSFANVLIHRIPRGESIVHPPSRCPTCGTRIRWFDNVPVVSWVVLRGSCRDCGAAISPRYPAVELGMGILAAFVGWKYGFTAVGVLLAGLLLVLLVVSFIDAATMEVPNVLSYFAVAAGVLCAPFNALLGDDWFVRSVSALAGALAGFGLLLVVGVAGGRVFRKDAVGGGDIKLFTAVGACLGWSAVGPVLFYASLVATVYVAVKALIRRRNPFGTYVPFVPFITAGVIVYLVRR